MAFNSYSDFIRALETVGELKRISKPVATELEITEIADREMKKPGGGKALLFERPTVNGIESPFPLAINTLGSYRRMAMSLEADSVDAVAAELGALIRAKPPTNMRDALALLRTAFELRHAKPKIVHEGPCKEVIHRYDAPATVANWPEPKPIADLAKDRAENPTPSLATLLNLPIQQCWPLDGGRFITMPCVVTKDPDTGERNVGMYR